MRIALYNRWLHIQGGGERHSVALAAVLSQRHSVTLLAHQAVDLTALGDFLGLDVRGLQLEIVPDQPSALAAAVARHDGFIGASHTDLVPAPAGRSALLVFFPPALQPPPTSSAWLSGWHAVEEGPEGPFRWSGPRAALHLLPRPYRRAVALGLQAPQPHTVVRLASGDWRSEVKLQPRVGWVKVVVPAGATTIELESPAFRTPGDLRVLGVGLIGMSIASSGWQVGERWQAEVGELADHPQFTAERVAGYEQIVANSAYTQQWIARRWQRPSAVLYPPLRPAPPARPKEQLILSVGRFFAGGHAKQHAVLIAAFQRLWQTGGRDWRLVLAGGLDAANPAHQDYFDDLQAQLGAAPITLAPNLTAAALDEQFAAASIYWHAGGFGVDQEAQPEAVEHFGITVAEALAAGAVPVVFAAGGPAEIVADGAQGRHWQTPDELVALTEALIAQPAELVRLRQAGLERAADFSAVAFERRVWELFGDW